MADYLMNLQKDGIQKKILYAGTKGPPDYPDGTKIYFHYKTNKCDEDSTVLDDSRNHEKPMELIIGKKFKFECWEACLKTMKLKEVAEFTVPTQNYKCSFLSNKQAASYPMVAKSLRDIFMKKKGAAHTSHCCGMMSMAEHGIGYDDLNELMKTPQPLKFTLEILKIEKPGEFEKELWTLSENEKIQLIPKLKDDGNALFKEKKYNEAAQKYGEALALLEELVLKEKPGDPEWNQIEDQKIPYLLNFAQCKLFLNEYYPVIEHTSTVLKRDPDNVKALFRRAKAHVGAWNPKEAKEDFQRVAELDHSLATTVQKELKLLEEKEKQKDEEDKQKLKGLFT